MKTVDQILSECLSTHSLQVLDSQHESDMRSEVITAMLAYHNIQVDMAPYIELHAVTDEQWEQCWLLAIGFKLEWRQSPIKFKLSTGDQVVEVCGQDRICLYVNSAGIITCYTAGPDDTVYDATMAAVVNYLQSIGVKFP